MNFILNTELSRWLRDEKIGGDREAIFLYALWSWCEKNAANEHNYHEGRYWSYNSLRGLTRIFPWTKRELENTVNRLRDAGLILTAKLSKDPKDTTLSYTVIAEKIGVSPFRETVSPTGETVSPIGDASPSPSGETVSPHGDNLSPTGETLDEQYKTHIVIQANKNKQDANKDGQTENKLTPRQAMELYNQICIDLPPCIRLTDKRQRSVRALFKKGITPEQLESSFRIAQSSEFCRGKNKTGWRVDFDWLLDENNIVKVLEGKYSGSTTPPKPSKPTKEERRYEHW